MPQSTAAELSWGRRYLMVRPDHFRVQYRINPFMDLDSQPLPDRATEQWRDLLATLGDAGAEVEVVEARSDAPDMVYAMNLGLAFAGTAGDARVALSHMRYAERRMETVSASTWFAGAGFAPTYVGADGVGAHFEAGDAFPFGGGLLVGYGPRTEKLALKHLASQFDIRVHGLALTSGAMYHLDLAFCPLDSRRALVCPSAFDEPSRRALLDLVPEPILVTEEEALATFCTNSVVVGRTVVMPACPDRVRSELERAGFGVVVVDVSEFHKGGGSVRCLTNPLDITVGRDLDVVPGGDVVLPLR
jgi:N-dimethylarginine dimethylaminohydrolase